MAGGRGVAASGAWEAESAMACWLPVSSGLSVCDGCRCGQTLAVSRLSKTVWKNASKAVSDLSTRA
jgi:hypothetical protein